MVKKKRGQVGIEYIMIVGFVTFAIISIIALAFFYSGQIKDRIRLNQVENFATQLVNSAESVFSAGEPSKATLKLYLPDGVQSIEINQDYILITTQTEGGQNKRSFDSQVPLQPGIITPEEGIKKLSIVATANNVVISQVTS
ncbi:hypothetical protein HY212_02280 [Candidatus Pacearchaeota archaeon]|nr:hypothetical protein [Candidatus Pacearchaeota archaeon]